MSGFFKRNSSGIIVYGGGIFIIIALLVNIIVHERPDRPYVHPHIQAPSYVRPAGCTLSYEKGLLPGSIEVVSKACADPQYSFQEEAHQYGLFHLPLGRGTHDFYRYENDVYVLSCGYSPTCIVDYVERDVFYQ